MTRTIGIKIICVATALILALASIFGVAKITTDPAFYQKSIAALEEKQETVLELTAASTAASAAITLLPGDTATPIADKLADLSGYFLIVLCAIFLEKIFADHHRRCGIQGPDPGGLRSLCHCGAVPPSAADGGRAGVETGIVQRSNHAGNPGGDPGQ